MAYERKLAPGQRCRVHVLDTVTGEASVVLDTDRILLEAPNWTPDGLLILNGDGLLWSLSPEGGEPVHIPLDGVPDLNNDHVLAPDGETIYVSANDWQIYAAPLAGGAVRQITSGDDVLHFLHGVSPDGTTLAYIGVVAREDGNGWAAANIYTIGVDGSGDTALTTGDKPADGSEYSPDGEWLYFNTEVFSSEPGHAQIARMPAAGGAAEQLTFDERVNWFPHFAPDGETIVYLSFPTGTIGHPADLPVEIRIVRGGDWSKTETLVSLFGGQGTINVNGWAPDSRRFAYVDYPITADAASASAASGDEVGA